MITLRTLYKIIIIEAYAVAMISTPIPSLAQCAQVKLFVLDVDGVLTNGDIQYTSSGEEFKTFNVKDGHGLALWSHYGQKTAIITGRSSSIVEKRAQELNIQYLFQGARNKLEVLTQLCAELQLDLSDVCYIGDDWPDLACLNAVGLSVCPADAVAEVQAACQWVTTATGGNGVAREVLNHLIKAKGFELK